MYQNGEGVEQNSIEALRWYQLSAENNDQWGQYNLGYMYENGQGVQQNHKMALKWYKLAADQGNVQNFGLSLLLKVAIDYALKSYSLAAKNNYASAQNAMRVFI